MFKRIIFLFNICFLITAQDNQKPQDQELIQAAKIVKNKKNVLDVVAAIKPIQDIIAGYLDVHDVLKKTINNVTYTFLTPIPNTNYFAALQKHNNNFFIYTYEFVDCNLILLGIYDLGTKEVASIAAHPNGKEIAFIASCENDNFELYALDLLSSKIQKVKADDLNGLFAFSQSGFMVALGSLSGSTDVYIGNDWKKLQRSSLRIRLKPVYTTARALAFSPDNKLALGTHNGFSMGSIQFFNCDTEEITKLPNSGMMNEVRSMAYSSDGNFLVACGSCINNIKIWNTKTQSLIHESSTGADHIVGFSADKKYLITLLGTSQYIWGNTACELEYEETEKRLA